MLKIPFFQREYVWSEKNWESLRDDLLSSDSDHFLGSVILKPEPCLGSAVAEWNVIDGQQRLTTLSVLLKVCVDKILYDPDTAENTKQRN